LAITLAGMGWLSQLTASTPYLTGVALPMVLIGIGQGLGFAPLTAAGLAGTTARDAGAASGLVNTTRQLGSTLGVALLVTLAAGATDLPTRVTTAYTGGTVMLAAALIAVLVLIVPSELAARRVMPAPALPQAAR
jgi:sugar phosphate permease